MSNCLETSRLILRPWQEADAESLYKYAKDPAVGPVAGWPPHASVEHSREIIRTVFSEPETYAVVLKETGEPVGSAGIMRGDGMHSADMQADEAEIGYWIGVPYWGKGMIPEAVRCLLRRCFADLGVSAVWCGFYDGNRQSQRVMEKCGLTYHHTETGKVSPLGDVRTEHFMRITAEEWNLRNGILRDSPDLNDSPEICLVSSDKKRYLSLLLLADEQESMIDRYLERGDLYVMRDKQAHDAFAVAVVTFEGEGVCELKNLAVSPQCQRKGIGKRMVEYLFGRYKGMCHTMLVGTGDSRQTVGFYLSCGFTYSHTVPDFFTQHYDHLIVEEGQVLRDMLYFRRTL